MGGVPGSLGTDHGHKFSECRGGRKRAKLVVSVLKPQSLVRGGRIQTKNKNGSLVSHRLSPALGSFVSAVPCGSAISE